MEEKKKKNSDVWALEFYESDKGHEVRTKEIWTTIWNQFTFLYHAILKFLPTFLSPVLCTEETQLILKILITRNETKIRPSFLSDRPVHDRVFCDANLAIARILNWWDHLWEAVSLAPLLNCLMDVPRDDECDLLRHGKHAHDTEIQGVYRFAGSFRCAACKTHVC